MGMRKTLKGLAFTLASCGALASPALADGTRELHEQVRHRVMGAVGQAAGRQELRDALAADPGFQRLLDRIRRHSLWRVRGDEDGEDALQSALLKMWRGRPELFLLDLDDVVRYLSVATRRNLISEHARVLSGMEDEGRIAGEDPADPAGFASACDILERLGPRLTPREREVLECRLAGVRSQRDVAARLGCSRYEVMRAGEGLERKARSLFEEELDEEPAGAPVSDR